MNKREEYLKKHPYAISVGKDGYCRTYIPTEDGGRKQIKKKNQREVEDVVIEYWEKKGEHTFKDRFSVWVKRQEACNRSGNTIDKYWSDYRRCFENDEFENYDVRKITDVEISLFIKRLLKRKKIPYRALKSVFGYMKGVFDKCIIDKLIQDNPCKYVDLPIFKSMCVEPRAKTSEERTLSEQERNVLLKNIHKNPTAEKYAVELSLYTGMRVGELSALMWEDVNYEKGYIKVHRSEKYDRQSNTYYISTTKNNKIRYVPLTEQMIDVLRRAKLESARNGILSEFIFCNKEGNIHTKEISECVRMNTDSKQFTCRKSIHAIRRTLNSNMRCMGVPITIASAILGHTEEVNEKNYTYDVSSMDAKREYIRLAGKIG